MKGRIAANVGCFVVMILFNLGIGGWSVNYLLAVFANKTLPFWGAALIGFFVGEFSAPAAIVVALLRHFGVL
jgi:hypothetical protein